MWRTNGTIVITIIWWLPNYNNDDDGDRDMLKPTQLNNNNKNHNNNYNDTHDNINMNDSDRIQNWWYSIRTDIVSLLWRHNDRDGVSNHQPYDCLLKCLFRRKSKKTSKLRVTGLCAWNSPVNGDQ